MKANDATQTVPTRSLSHNYITSCVQRHGLTGLYYGENYCSTAGRSKVKHGKLPAYVTRSGKTWHIARMRNARLLYLKSKIVQFLTYSCQKTFLLTLPTDGKRKLRRRNKHYLQAPRSRQAVQLLCTEPVAKGVNWNSRVRAVLDTATIVELLNDDSPFQHLRHRRRSGS